MSQDIANLGLGTFPFSNVFSKIDEKEALNIVEIFIGMGCKYIETAPVYPVKNIQLKDVLKNFDREKYYLATKCITGQNEKGEKIRSGKKKSIMSQCDQELKRLNVEYIDLLQTHIVAEDASIEETSNALQELKDIGKVKEIGVSNVSLEQLKKYKEYCDVNFVQNRFSIIHQSQIKTIESYCSENDIYLNPYQVIERGLLTSRPTDDGRWRDGDLRNSKFEYKGDAYYLIRKWVERELVPIAKDNDISVEGLMVAWTNAQPQVRVVVVGVTNHIQLNNLLRGIRVELDNQVLSKMINAYNDLLKEISDKYNLTIEEFRGLK
jgi:aryl-alcohol dehydrogenase-like predicted oxidoreductase